MRRKGAKASVWLGPRSSEIGASEEWILSGEEAPAQELLKRIFANGGIQYGADGDNR